MKKDVLQAFATRVTQANKTELVVIIYEAALASIEEGRKALDAGMNAHIAKPIDPENMKAVLTELLFD